MQRDRTEPAAKEPLVSRRDRACFVQVCRVCRQRREMPAARQLRSVFAVSTRGILYTVQRLLPLLADGASILINGSAGSARGTPGTTVYGASKAALRSFTRTSWPVAGSA